MREAVYQRRSFAGRALVGGFFVVAALCAGWVVWSFLGDAMQDLMPMVSFGVTALILVGGHGLTTWWTLTSLPHWTQQVLLHAPYPVLYVMTYLWFFGEWDPTSGGSPSTWYLYWGCSRIHRALVADRVVATR